MALKKMWKNNHGTCYVTIPKAIREAADLEPGEMVDIEYDDQRRGIEIRKVEVKPK